MHVLVPKRAKVRLQQSTWSAMESQDCSPCSETSRSLYRQCIAWLRGGNGTWPRVGLHKFQALARCTLTLIVGPQNRSASRPGLLGAYNLGGWLSCRTQCPVPGSWKAHLFSGCTAMLSHVVGSHHSSQRRRRAPHLDAKKPTAAVAPPGTAASVRLPKAVLCLYIARLPLSRGGLQIVFGVCFDFHSAHGYQEFARHST